MLDLLKGDGYEVTGLVRRDEHAEQIKSSGALAVKGDLNDHDLVVKHVLEHGVRLWTFDSIEKTERDLEGHEIPWSQSRMHPWA